MKAIKFRYRESSQIKESLLQQTLERLQPEITKISTVQREGGYATDYASINVPSDTGMYEVIQAVIDQKKALQPTVLVVIGIGGSNLGTIAVHEALNGHFYNEKNPSIKVYFADTVDSDTLTDQLMLIERELKASNNVLINVVTKSGSTTETIVNFKIFLALLKRYKPDDFYKYIVITTNHDSKLAIFGKQQGMAVLAIPKNVGGRYSVFTAVGQFPLGILGVDLHSLLQGARDSLGPCLSQSIDNPAAASAIVKYVHYTKGSNINDLFVFSKQLFSFGLWYRQLMGESIGKEAADTKKVVGITPTVSVGSTDLHSVGQLYLGGPHDKVITFVTIESSKNIIKIPSFPDFEQFVAKIQGKSVSSIMDAIVRGVQVAYMKQNRPYMAVVLPEKNAYYIGYMLQMYMIEMIYLGVLLGVNPFDQPHVELYKKEII